MKSRTQRLGPPHRLYSFFPAVAVVPVGILLWLRRSPVQADPRAHRRPTLQRATLSLHLV